MNIKTVKTSNRYFGSYYDKDRDGYPTLVIRFISERQRTAYRNMLNELEEAGAKEDRKRVRA